MKLINQSLSVFSLFLVVGILSSCASSKYSSLLNGHTNMLNYAATADLKAEERTDILMNTLVKVMQESLDIDNEKRGADYATKFFEQNEDNIDQIITQIKPDEVHLDAKSGLKQLLKLREKPYIKEAINLTPKFLQRYKDYQFIVDATKKVRGALGDMALDKVLDEVLDKIN